MILIIPARSESASIGETLRSLHAHTRRPDDIIVVCDNGSDATAEVSAWHGAPIMTTAGNTVRKAARSARHTAVLPGLDRRDLVLLMDAAIELCGNWTRCAVDALGPGRRLGGVCGTYSGEATPGLLDQLQRKEFIRAARPGRSRAECRSVRDDAPTALRRGSAAFLTGEFLTLRAQDPVLMGSGGWHVGLRPASEAAWSSSGDAEAGLRASPGPRQTRSRLVQRTHVA